jgi:hypothetical protein
MTPKDVFGLCPHRTPKRPGYITLQGSSRIFSRGARMSMEYATTRSETARWGSYATLIGVLVLALFVRFQGITYGLPLDFYAPDEAEKAGIVAHFGTGNSWTHPRNPHFC